MLTIIATCLAHLCARAAAPPVEARDSPTRVVITGITLERGDARNVS